MVVWWGRAHTARARVSASSGFTPTKHAVVDAVCITLHVMLVISIFYAAEAGGATSSGSCRVHTMQVVTTSTSRQ